MLASKIKVRLILVWLVKKEVTKDGVPELMKLHFKFTG